MSKLLTLNKENIGDFITKIVESDIMILEDIQGSKIWINYDGKNVNIRPRNLNCENLNLIDLALQKYYNKAIEVFYSLGERVKSLLNKNWWFGFEYFPDNQPANILYDRTPKNSLILTSINKSGKFKYSYEELVEYSNLIDCDPLPVIFKGKLNEIQVEAIQYFVSTSKEDLEYVFEEENFAYFFYKLLNPLCKNSFLMNDNFQENIEKLIIQFNDEEISFQILNPLYERLNSDNKTEFSEIYSLLILNFLDFCQLIDLSKLKLKSTKREDLYVELICRLYNIYIDSVKDDILNFEFVIPKFFNKDKFKINVEVLPNTLTQTYIKESPKLEYLFKIILSSFSKKRKKEIGLFTTKSVSLFNQYVSDINIFLDKQLNVFSEIELAKSGLLNFEDYFNIKYDTDAEGDIYASTGSDIKSGETKSKSKDKIKPGTKDTIK